MEKRSRVARLKFLLLSPLWFPILFHFSSFSFAPSSSFQRCSFLAELRVRHKRFNNRRRKRVYTEVEGNAVSFAPVICIK